MARSITLGEFPALVRGVALLGGGGGGDPQTFGHFARAATTWPVRLKSLHELDPQMPCIAVGIGGSTMVLGERLPDPTLFDTAVAAVERWTGKRAPAVCPIQIGGLNGLTPFPLAGTRQLVDADLMGRALPGIDQFSLFTDGLPGLVIAAATGGDGVLVHAGARPEDAEHVLRAAFESAGGWAGAVLGGFHIGDLAEHAVAGSVSRALDLGTASLAWSGESSAHGAHRLAEALGARLLGEGRVHAMQYDAVDHRIMTLDIRTHDGDLLRVIGSSEYIACLVNGAPVAAAPTIIVVIDAVTGNPISAETPMTGRRVHVLALAAPSFWDTDDRRHRVGPQRYGLSDFDLTDPHLEEQRHG